MKSVWRADLVRQESSTSSILLGFLDGPNVSWCVLIRYDSPGCWLVRPYRNVKSNTDFLNIQRWRINRFSIVTPCSGGLHLQRYKTCDLTSGPSGGHSSSFCFTEPKILCKSIFYSKDITNPLSHCYYNLKRSSRDLVRPDPYPTSN